MCRRLALQLFTEASRDMYACWTRVAHTSVYGRKEPLQFSEMLLSRGGWQLPRSGLLAFDHVVLQPVPPGCPCPIGIVGFHVLKQQVMRNIQSGMPMPAVQDALLYMRMASESEVKFSTEQAFSLMALVPMPRR
jgi:hypothetical protein